MMQIHIIGTKFHSMDFTFKILLIFVLFIKCNFKTNTIPVNFSQIENRTTVKEKFDTIVVSKIIPAEISGLNYIEKEYFIVIKKDTSSFSCIISKNKIKGNISMRYYYNPNGKTPNSFSFEDSAAIIESRSEKRKQYYIPKYKEQIKELKIILEHIVKDFDLSKLNSFRMSMQSFRSFTQSITKQYISLYGEKFGNESNKKVVDLIKKSELVVDLNRILLPYSVKINKIFLDGLAYYSPEGTILNENETLTGVASKKIIDGLVIFSIVFIPSKSQ